MTEGRGSKLIIGFVLLHVLCCGAVLLFGAGALAAVGGLLNQPLLIAGGVLLAMISLALAARRTRGTPRTDCCSPSQDAAAPLARTPADRA